MEWINDLSGLFFAAILGYGLYVLEKTERHVRAIREMMERERKDAE